jgi:Holliday junction resolvasome RuvABC DNA-binding subunit
MVLDWIPARKARTCASLRLTGLRSGNSIGPKYAMDIAMIMSVAMPTMKNCITRVDRARLVGTLKTSESGA